MYLLLFFCLYCTVISSYALGKHAGVNFIVRGKPYTSAQSLLLQTRSLLHRESGYRSDDTNSDDDQRLITRVFGSRNYNKPKGYGGYQRQKKPLIKFSATNCIIFLNAVVLLLTSQSPRLKMRLMKDNFRIYYGETYRLLSALFVHGSFYHFMMNSYSLTNL